MFFGFMIARMLARGGSNALKGKGIDPKDIKPTPVGPFVIGAIVAMIGVCLVVALAHGVTAAPLTWLILTSAALILGGLFIRGVTEGLGRRDALSRMPDLPNPENELHTARQMRARASVLEHPEAPTVPVQPRYTSRRALISEAEDDERLLRVAAILLAPCPDCEVDEAELCRFKQGAAATILDQDRDIVVHDHRIGNAIKLQTAKVTEVVAQFDGHVPDGVWETAL